MPTRDGFSPRPGAGVPPRAERNATPHSTGFRGSGSPSGASPSGLKRGSVGGVALSPSGPAHCRVGRCFRPSSPCRWRCSSGGSMHRSPGPTGACSTSTSRSSMGERPPPLIGEESAAAKILPEPPNPARWALLSSPGAGLHLMMVGVSRPVQPSHLSRQVRCGWGWLPPPPPRQPSAAGQEFVPQEA